MINILVHADILLRRVMHTQLEILVQQQTDNIGYPKKCAKATVINM